MSNFFTKRGAEAPPPQAPTAPPNGMPPLVIAFDALNAQPQPESVEEQSAPKAPQLSSSSQPDIEPSSQSSMSVSSTQTSSLKLSQESSHESLKRSRTGTPNAAGGSKPKKLKAGQSKLSSFFAKPTTTTTPPTASTNASAPSDRAGSSSSEIIDLCEDSEETEMQSSSMPMPMPTITSEIRLPVDKANNNPTTYSQSREKNENGKTGSSASSSWSAVFMPKPPPPLCTVHREPSKEFRVNKPGPNKGKTFYLCARPVGPGYDKGRNERLREEVDHQYKCNFFMWTSDAKRDAMRAAAATSSDVVGATSQGKRESGEDIFVGL
jgi:AP endonuclease-2